jgi:Protein of unknown function, DUF547
MRCGLRVMAACLCAVLCTAAPRAQDGSADAGRKILDQILDTYVRDGLVYYRALQVDRGKLDGYVAQLGRAAPDQLPRNDQIAFWLNAYNALVLKTVVDHYPIRGKSPAYPAKSIRQVPGAFERVSHQVGGRRLTLDQIEQTILSRFNDPRLFFAIGRGSVGGGRLRSEAFAPARLESQLAEVAAECTSRAQCVQVDAASNTLTASPIFSWRQQEFITADAGQAPPEFAGRSPVERAILAFVGPTLLASERAFLEKNTFRLAYRTYDWSLNDLTGRGGR